MNGSVILRWTKGSLPTGPFAGPVWGAKLGAAFLMVVPVKPLVRPRRGQQASPPAAFEAWFADMVLGERKTLLEAQAFAESMLRGYLDRIGTGLAALSTVAPAPARAA